MFLIDMKFTSKLVEFVVGNLSFIDPPLQFFITIYARMSKKKQSIDNKMISDPIEYCIIEIRY